MAATWVVLALVGCSAGSSPAGDGAAPASSSSTPGGFGPSASTSAQQQPPAAVQVTALPWRLPAPLSRPVVLARGSDLLVAGGLDAASRSVATTRDIAATNGTVVSSGRLAVAVHDAAGAVLGGRAFVFGGGSTAVGDSVQTVARRGRVVASLPRPRADLAATTVAGSSADTAYLVGGYDGTTADRTVLATTDGTTFRDVGRLTVGVRYAAVVGLGDALWVFGGQVGGAPVDLIQRMDLATGRTRVVGHLPRPLSDASAVVLAGQVLLAGGLTTGDGRMATVWRFDPQQVRLRAVGELPLATSDMGAAVVGDTAYLVGGEAPGPVRSVVALTLRSGALTPADAGSLQDGQLGWLSSPDVPSHLMAGSDPSVLPGPLLIADKLNNRLVVVDPQGRVRWQFPRPGDLRPGQTFRIPDDAFFSPSGRQIIATEEDDYVISIIDIASHRLVYRYGKPGVPGSGPNRLNNPDDAILQPGGGILLADIKNCRILRIRHGAHRPMRVYGTTGVCGHRPPRLFGSPNGAFPLSNGNYLVTEIQGSFVDEMTPSGHVIWSTRLPGVGYPSDSNQVRPGVYLTVGYTSPGQVVEFTAKGKVLWRWRPLGAQRLDHPSLALPLPGGDVLVTDDFNHRVLVVDPRTDRVVWQYGHRGAAGSDAGYLNNPDGLDLLPPNQLVGVLSGR